MSNIDNNPGALLAKITKLERELERKEAYSPSVARVLVRVAAFTVAGWCLGALAGYLMFPDPAKASPYHPVGYTTPKRLPVEAVIIAYQDSAGIWHDYETGRTVSPPKYWRLK